MGSAALFLIFSTALPHAQGPASRSIVVTETAGIRRTEYPTAARVEIARGALRDVANARLRFDDADVPAQFTADSRWDDGSVRGLSVDFNVSIGPTESRTYQIEYGPQVTAPPFKGRGLTVTETADAIQVGSVRFSKAAVPLILSANYVKAEFIRSGPNGFSVTDDSRRRHDLSTAESLTLDIEKRGPLNVRLRYAGRLPFDASYSLPFVVMVEMPNSKSWVKLTARVEDAGRRVRALALETPLAFGPHPWTWDFGTENGTYGAFRMATDVAVLGQVVDDKGPVRWDVQTGSAGQPRPYEMSPPGRSAAARGWGHLLDSRAAVAFAVDRFAERPGMHMISLNGEGLATFALVVDEPATQHELTVYQHFVSTPVPIGAATSPQSMLNALRVEVR